MCKINNTSGKQNLVLLDSDSTFNAMSRDYIFLELQWTNRFDRSNELQELKTKFNIKFQFNTAHSPQLQSLVERINKVIDYSLM